MKKRKIFISGAISNDPVYKIKFSHWKKVLKAKTNATIYSPIDLYQYDERLSEKENWARAMVQCLNTLKYCTDIFIIPEKIESVGVRIEIMFADKLGINILTEHEL